MSSSEQMAKSRETLTPRPIDRGVRIGHVHLKVADLERALKFYCGVLGFELTQRRPGRSEEHTSELQSRFERVCRLLLEKKNVMVIAFRILIGIVVGVSEAGACVLS